jgi:protein SCO1/2
LVQGRRASISSRGVAVFGTVVLIVAATFSRVTAHEMALHGLVLGTLPAKSEVIVRHDALFGKPAGLSVFRVQPASAMRLARIGATIGGTADADSTPWTLREIRVLGSESVTGAPVEAAAPPRVLRDVHHVAIGEYAPVPAFVDQTGRPFSLRDLRGQMVVLAFVYTRCRDARECPLITARFHILEDAFRGMPVHLVEVTLDPSHDRPAVLARYGRTFGADPARWTLATGDPDTVLDFAAQFDVTAFPDERVGLIHPERTVILDTYGAIRELIDEGAWTPDEIEATVAHDRRLASNPIERLDLWLSSAAVAVCGNAVAGFSGFTDLLTVFGIAAFFAFLLWKLGRGIARGAA